MTLSRVNTKDDDPRKFAEERRLILLLGEYLLVTPPLRRYTMLEVAQAIKVVIYKIA